MLICSQPRGRQIKAKVFPLSKGDVGFSSRALSGGEQGPGRAARVSAGQSRGEQAAARREVSPSPLREASGSVSALEQQFAFPFLSPPRFSVCPSSPAGPPSPRGLVRSELPWGKVVGVWQLPSPSTADTKVTCVHHHSPGGAAGGLCGGTHGGDAGSGRQAGPWAGKRRGCERADSSPSSCLGRGWLCLGTIRPGGAEGFLQLPASLRGLAGNTSPPCPGSDPLIPTESSWHHCYNSRTRFCVFSRPIPPCCLQIKPREWLK